MTKHHNNDHTDCDSAWCGALKSDTYCHKNLPYGKDLTSEELKQALLKIYVDGLSSQVDKLAKLGSSQANESFNNLLATKAPKFKHFSETASLYYRLCASVLQKNIGYTYLSQVRC